VAAGSPTPPALRAPPTRGDYGCLSLNSPPELDIPDLRQAETTRTVDHAEQIRPRPAAGPSNRPSVFRSLHGRMIRSAQIVRSLTLVILNPF
jgi:hypothetical protein